MTDVELGITLAKMAYVARHLGASPLMAFAFGLSVLAVLGTLLVVLLPPEEDEDEKK